MVTERGPSQSVLVSYSRVVEGIQLEQGQRRQFQQILREPSSPKYEASTV